MDEKGPIARLMSAFLRNGQVWIVIGSIVFLGVVVVARSGLLP